MLNIIELKKAVDYMNTVKFGAYISKLRKEKDMPQSALADLLNVTRQAVSKWERGESFPDISILCLIADVFGVSLDTLINAGGTSKSQTAILSSVSRNQEIPKEIFEDKDIIKDVINIAPYLKASTLSLIAEKLSKHNIDIGRIVELSEFMNDESIVELFNNNDIDMPDDALLEKLIPFLGQESLYAIFEKVMNGENGENLLKVMRPYMLYGGFYSLVEAAVVQGVFNYSVYKNILR